MDHQGAASSGHDVWAIRLAGDEATRKAGQNLREWAGDNRSRTRRFLDRVTFREDRDPKLSGAWGEELVAKALARLGDGWTVVHGVRIGPKADVDHIVVGPPGVFCLNTKRIDFEAKVVVSARQFRVNGYSRDFYPKSVREARRVAARLEAAGSQPVAVHPLVVVNGVDPKRFVVREQPVDVTVVTRRGLVSWLTAQRASLTPAEVARIGRLVRQPSTWDPSKTVQVLDRPATPAVAPQKPPKTSSDVTVVRWKRYGHDRLYVNDARTGQRLGWRDLRTGLLHVENGVDPFDIERVLDIHAEAE